MKEILWKWLPIVFGCHGRPERSFHYRGVPFPICARCTGELVGILAGILFYRIGVPTVRVLLFLLVPLIADGTIQALTSYESTNGKRFATGFLFGYALLTLFFWSTGAVFQYGRGLAKRFL